MKEPVERLKEKVRKENLWIFILRLLKDERKYAAELRKEVKDRFGFWIGNVTAYKVLYLLEKDGYVDVEEEGRKKYYSITEKGEEQLDKAGEFFRDTVSKLSGEQ